MAKSRAQRKAERRSARPARRRRPARNAPRSRAPSTTPRSPSRPTCVEAELAEQGADIDALRAQGEEPARRRRPRAPTSASLPRSREPEGAESSPAASAGARSASSRRRRRASEERRKPKDEPVERQRGRVTGFLASCWAELKRVQWPDRETLIQASAITLIFIAVAAAYLGVLDAIFSELVQIVL